MQPNKTKLALQVGALLIGTSCAFTASAALFTVTAEAVPDVSVVLAHGTGISFGSGIIGNKNGSSCDMDGISAISEAQLMLDVTSDGANANSAQLITEMPLGGAACINGNTGGAVVLEIDGADASTVTVNVANVTGTGWVYSPSAESCVVDFDRATTSAQDICVPLTTNTVTGVGMSATQVNGVTTAADEIPDTATGYADIVGKTRMVLSGSLALTADLGQGTVVSETIIVQVTYE